MKEEEENAVFETCICEGYFNISIEDESSYSCDGGYSYDTDVFSFDLNKEQANVLMFELKKYIEGKS